MYISTKFCQNRINIFCEREKLNPKQFFCIFLKKFIFLKNACIKVVDLIIIYNFSIQLFRQELQFRRNCTKSFFNPHNAPYHPPPCPISSSCPSIIQNFPTIQILRTILFFQNILALHNFQYCQHQKGHKNRHSFGIKMHTNFQIERSRY